MFAIRSIPRLDPGWKWYGCEQGWVSERAWLNGFATFFQAPSKPHIMALWGLVSKIPSEKLQRLYVDFPPHLRHLLGEWLEFQPW